MSKKILTYLGMFHYGKKFFQSAEQLYIKSENSFQEFYPVIHYTCFHSIELIFKSFLLYKGHCIKVLKDTYGHDLKILLNKVNEEGLSLSIDSSDTIKEFSEMYKNKEFEYMSPGYKTIPTNEGVMEITKEVIFLVKKKMNIN